MRPQRMCCALARRVGESVNLREGDKKGRVELRQIYILFNSKLRPCSKAKALYIFHNGGNGGESTLISKISEHY